MKSPLQLESALRESVKVRLAMKDCCRQGGMLLAVGNGGSVKGAVHDLSVPYGALTACTCRGIIAEV